MNKTFVAAFALSLLAGTSAFAQEHQRGDRGNHGQGHATEHRQQQADRQDKHDSAPQKQRDDSRPARSVPQVSNERVREAVAQARTRQVEHNVAARERGDERAGRGQNVTAQAVAQAAARRQAAERRTRQKPVVAVPRVAPRTQAPRQTDRNRYDRRDNGDQHVYLRGGHDNHQNVDRRRPGEGHQLRARDHGRQWYNANQWRQTYRATHRYRVQHYRAPAGFYIRSWVFGDFLPQTWYAPNYYLNWWSYGLPRPPIGTEWVRSGDDALLVDTWSGEVLSVYYDLFW